MTATASTPPVHDFKFLETAADASKVPELPKIYLAVCSSDWKAEIHTTESIRAIGNLCRCEVHPRFMFNDGVARSRNNLAAEFLATDCTHIFFLDSDIVIEPRQFALLLEALEDGIQVIGGLYPKKQATLDWVINHLADQKPDAKGRVRLKHIGNGCMIIERSVLLRQIELHPEIEYRGDPDANSVRWDFFPMGARAGRYESEDWAFCNRLNADGVEIWGHTGVQLRHVGKIVYPLQFTLSDDDVVDLIFHRYAIPTEASWAFIASGEKQPGMMGGHRERPVRLWPEDYAGIGDLDEAGVMLGALDVPVSPGNDEAPPRVIDVGAGIGAFLRFAVKRWPRCSVDAFESDEKRFALLERTAAGCNPAVSPVTVERKEFSSDNALEVPEGSILRLNVPESMLILARMADAGRAGVYDAILGTFRTLKEAANAELAIMATHSLNGLQRMADGTFVAKFIARRLIPEKG